MWKTNWFREGEMTVVCHVDNMKVSHKDPFEVTKCYLYLLEIYGNKLKVHIGKKHDYLGLVFFKMIKCPQKVLDK